MSDQAGAGLMLSPAGASAGSARVNAALKEPFRSEPQMVRMFRASAMWSPVSLNVSELGYLSELGYQRVWCKVAGPPRGRLEVILNRPRGEFIAARCLPFRERPSIW